MRQLLFFLVILLAALHVPFVSTLARLCLVGYVFGAVLCSIFRYNHSFIEGAAVSVAGSTAALLLLTVFIAPGSPWFAAAFSLIALVLALVAYMRHKRFSALRFTRDRHLFIVLTAVLLPFIIIFALNPYIHFLSDGWWHASIYSLMQHYSMPLPTPWLDGAQLAYPFAMHLVLHYVFSLSGLPVVAVFIIATLLCTALTASILYRFIQRISDKQTALAGATAFFLLSSIGSIVFVIDAVRLLASGSVEQYLSFLHVHQGPHMWYTAMKFINPTGINTVFQSSAMLAFFPLLLFVGTICFLLEKRYATAAVLYAPLLTANPVYAIIAGLFIAAVLVYDKGLKGLLYAAATALAALVVNLSYIRSLLTKELVGSGSFVALASGKGFWMLLLFAVGYAPLILIAVYALKKEYYNARIRSLLMLYAAVHLFVVLVLQLGYLYASTTGFLFLAVLCAPYLSKMRFTAKHLLAGTIVLVTLVSTLLIVATYSYYTISLDSAELDASMWLRENTPPQSLVLADVGTIEERSLKVYPSAFGERRVYLADLPSLTAYGEEYSQQKALYDAVFVHQEPVTCSLGEYGIDYVYASKNNTLRDCLRMVYENENIAIYTTS